MIALLILIYIVHFHYTRIDPPTAYPWFHMSLKEVLLQRLWNLVGSRSGVGRGKRKRGVAI